MLLVKLILILLLGFVIVSLFSGLYFLVRDKGQTNRTVNALTLRIGLSLLAIVVVLIAGATGVIEFNPNPLYSGTPQTVESGTSGSPDVGQENRGSSSGGRTRIEEGS